MDRNGILSEKEKRFRDEAWSDFERALAGRGDTEAMVEAKRLFETLSSWSMDMERQKSAVAAIDEAVEVVDHHAAYKPVTLDQVEDIFGKWGVRDAFPTVAPAFAMTIFASMRKDLEVLMYYGN